MYRRKFLLVFVATLILSGCSDPPVGTKARPFTMYFVPLLDAGVIATNADKMAADMQRLLSRALYGKDTGFYVKAAVPTSYVAVVEALGTGKADFAALTTFSYVLAKDIKKFDVEAIVKIVRGIDEHSYKAQFIAHADSDIKSIKDLAGKKLAYTDPASTAGFILPSKLLQQEGVELGEYVFAQRYDNVVTMVYQKQVDAGATYYRTAKVVEENGAKKTVLRDARALVSTQFPDVGDKVKIVGVTEEIPNAPWVIRKNVLADPATNANLKKALIDALVDYPGTKEGLEVLINLANVTGLMPTDDEEYANTRKMMMAANIDIEQAILNKTKKKK